MVGVSWLLDNVITVVFSNLNGYLSPSKVSVVTGGSRGVWEQFLVEDSGIRLHLNIIKVEGVV